MLVTGTNILCISFMIVFTLIKVIMTGTSYEETNGYIVKSIVIGFIILTVIETVAIFLIGNNIQITWE